LIQSPPYSPIHTFSISLYQYRSKLLNYCQVTVMAEALKETYRNIEILKRKNIQVNYACKVNR